jgi:hypothetical protein
MVGRARYAAMAVVISRLINERFRPRACKSAKVVYIEESDFFEAAT